MDIKNEKYKETRIQVGDSMAGGAEDGERGNSTLNRQGGNSIQ